MSQHSKRDQEYREYYNSLPPERQAYLDAVEGKPYKPQGNPDNYDPHASNGLVRTCLCLFGLYWLYECYEMVTGIGPRDGWFGLTFVFLVYGAIAWAIGSSIVQAFRTTQDERDDGEEDDPPSLPIPPDEEQEQQEDNERQRQYEAYQRMLEQERKRVRKRREAYKEQERILEQIRAEEEEEEEEENSEEEGMSEAEALYHMQERDRYYYRGKYGIDIDTMGYDLDRGGPPLRYDEYDLGDDYDPDNEHDPSIDYDTDEEE